MELEDEINLLFSGMDTLRLQGIIKSDLPLPTKFPTELYSTELRNHVFHKMTPPGFNKGRNLRVVPLIGSIAAAIL